MVADCCQYAGHVMRMTMRGASAPGLRVTAAGGGAAPHPRLVAGRHRTGYSLDDGGPTVLLVAVFGDHPAVVSKEAEMFASLVKRVTAPFRRKRCPECGHKVRETFCDVCGYDLIQRTRDKTFHTPAI